MTTDKSQPTGWVVVDFEDDEADGFGLPILDATYEWRRVDDRRVSPFCCIRQIEWSRLPTETSDEVHPWPLPASVFARLKESHPTVDWSQVPVAVEAAAAEPSEVERLTRERDELREELSRCKQAHSAAEDDVESLREQLGKATISRRDEFAKAALMGYCANPDFTSMSIQDMQECAINLADATIRALDGAGGA